MINFYKKYRLICNIIISLCSLFILSFIFFYGKNDLFKFPFDVEVWGNVSDWVNSAITLGSVIYVVKQFYSQKEQDRIKLLPIFKISRLIEAEDNSIPPILFLELTKNDAFDIAISRDNNQFCLEINGLLPLHTPFLAVGNNIQIVNLNLSARPIHASYVFSYKDLIGNTYFQVIIYKGAGRYVLDTPYLKSN